MEKRVEILEQKATGKRLDGIGHFYAMPLKDRERAMAPFYGEARTNGK